MTLWSAQEAAAATGGQAIGNWCVDGISIDTRSIAKGDLFVALKAARDGHDFVAQALEKGAAAALVSRRPEGVADDAPLLLVSDVQQALEDLGRAARARTDARVIAVTGSVGKTSTKEMLARMLSDQGRTHAAVASYNNHWGVPLTLARMPRDTDFAVIEIGMNHPGEIAPLAKQARPHVAMVTTVAPVHLEAFDGIEGIAAEKAAIMEGLEPGGVAVLNADIAEVPILQQVAQAQGATPRWFGAGDGPVTPDYRLVRTHLRGEETEAEVTDAAGRSHHLQIQSLGAHFAMNALGALACLAALDLDLGKAVQSLSLWSPVTGRGARETVSLGASLGAERGTGQGADRGEVLLLDDSYNANPTSVAAALAVLAATPCEGRRIAYLGDMKELGPQEQALHAALADLPAIADLDVVHCIGSLMGVLHAALPADKRGSHYASSAEVTPDLATQISAGDVVLAKGSLSMALVKVVDGIRELGHGETNS
ncbi:UDP-N-acetylmuramoyl-tripeptide--D-alanyl-D-alanine ligase [Phaeobacter sp.]|uniref:UDP-N-acetylmuramoyl-tripeptide--D-alanyl-D- alanine ligase n=1 Tax=Phaeobacter sp. TaxID=1902409 RepID=UPI0025F4A7CC|nr:UDP-N-acetylmuramoyl-tripeptide--D-alanyl-D-alanine ligase [Phaeobacter sp.]